mmetsp:Transcript_5276/g.18723  ORF Transcript_5276/g.18723 Transcript_5276/m.18723 type:complete len:272 (-) Transcript_5276:1059-1874(-)
MLLWRPLFNAPLGAPWILQRANGGPPPRGRVLPGPSHWDALVEMWANGHRARDFCAFGPSDAVTGRRRGAVVTAPRALGRDSKGASFRRLCSTRFGPPLFGDFFSDLQRRGNPCPFDPMQGDVCIRIRSPRNGARETEASLGSSAPLSAATRKGDNKARVEGGPSRDASALWDRVRLGRRRGHRRRSVLLGPFFGPLDSETAVPRDVAQSARTPLKDRGHARAFGTSSTAGPLPHLLEADSVSKGPLPEKDPQPLPFLPKRKNAKRANMVA